VGRTILAAFWFQRAVHLVLQDVFDLVPTARLVIEA
jgi:hypothetical protein